MDPFDPNKQSLPPFSSLFQRSATQQQTNTTATTTTITPTPSVTVQPLSSAAMGVSQAAQLTQHLPSTTSSYSPYYTYSRFDFGHVIATTSFDTRPSYSHPVAETSSMVLNTSPTFSAAVRTWENNPSQASTNSAAYLPVTTGSVLNPATGVSCMEDIDLTFELVGEWMAEDQAKASSHQSSSVPVHTQSQAPKYNLFAIPCTSSNQVTETMSPLTTTTASTSKTPQVITLDGATLGHGDLGQAVEAFNTPAVHAYIQHASNQTISIPPTEGTLQTHSSTFNKAPIQASNLQTRGRLAIENETSKHSNLQCPVCGKVFFRKYLLDSHINTHTGVKPFKCASCHKAFAHRSKLVSHKKKAHINLEHHSNQTQAQAQAQAATSLQSETPQVTELNLTIVSTSCVTEKPPHPTAATSTQRTEFKCTYCNKTFPDNWKLNTHIKTHTGERPFICKICDQTFARKGTLKQHEQTHAPNRPSYICPICAKSLLHLNSLKIHLKQHTQQNS